MHDTGKDPAFPLPGSINSADRGLTKREYFAGLAMAAFLSQAEYPFLKTECLIRSSIAHADRLLEELEYSADVMSAKEIAANETADRMAMDELRSEFAPTLLVEVCDD